jgi:hypothetical protein
MKKKPFKIPDALIRQIDECSNGGFILITLSENGQPEVRSRFDNALSAIGLVRYAAMWSSSIDEMNENMVSGSIFSEDDDEDDNQE